MLPSCRAMFSQLGPLLLEHGYEMTLRGPIRPQHGHEMAPKGPKMAPRGVKMAPKKAPRGLQYGCCTVHFCMTSSRIRHLVEYVAVIASNVQSTWPTVVPRWLRDDPQGPRRPKDGHAMATSWLQESPSWPQEAPRWRQEAPRWPPRWPQEAPRWVLDCSFLYDFIEDPAPRGVCCSHPQ